MSIIKSELFVVIFGQDFIDEIVSDGEQFSKLQWRLGRKSQFAKEMLPKIKAAIITGEVDNRFAEYILAYTNGDIDREIARLHGRKARTVRYYHDVVCHYTTAEQEQFEVLPFSHFEFAASMGVQKIKVLELSLRQMDRNGGRPPSVDWLKMQFTNAGNPADFEALEAAMDFDDAIAQPLTEEREPLPGVWFYIRTQATRMFESAYQQLERVEMKAEQREQVRVIFDRITDAMDELNEIFESEKEQS